MARGRACCLAPRCAEALGRWPATRRSRLGLFTLLVLELELLPLLLALLSVGVPAAVPSELMWMLSGLTSLAKTARAVAGGTAQRQAHCRQGTVLKSMYVGLQL